MRTTLIIYILFSFVKTIEASTINELLRIEVESNQRISVKTKQFYENRAFTPIWDMELKNSFDKLVQEIVYEGLNPIDYKPIEVGSKEKIEIDYTKKFIKLIEHLSIGKVDPSSVDQNWKMSLVEEKPYALLLNIKAPKDLDIMVESVKSKLPVYNVLKLELKSLLLNKIDSIQETKINQLKVNLERLRWMPKKFNSNRITVNTARFLMQYYQSNNLIHEEKVIVGKKARQTPVFNATMTYLVLNPTWTVPPGILKNDVIPGVRKSPGYLSAKKLLVYDKSGSVLNPSEIDWNSKEVFGYTYRQNPGKDNALGAVKFMFPNPYSIYLHDTPSKELFNNNERTFSSGCIRLHNPLDFAELLLKETEWDKEKIDKQIKSEKTVSIKLQSAFEVYIYYLTTYIDKEGNIVWLKDIYERDENLLKYL